MSKQNKSTQVGNRIILNGTALLLLAYMLAKIVQAYIAGGADAPSVKVLLLGIVVLGGGKVNGILDGRKTTKEEVGLRMTNLVKEEQA